MEPRRLEDSASALMLAIFEGITVGSAICSGFYLWDVLNVKGLICIDIGYPIPVAIPYPYFASPVSFGSDDRTGDGSSHGWTLANHNLFSVLSLLVLMTEPRLLATLILQNFKSNMFPTKLDNLFDAFVGYMTILLLTLGQICVCHCRYCYWKTLKIELTMLLSDEFLDNFKRDGYLSDDDITCELSEEKDLLSNKEALVQYTVRSPQEEALIPQAEEELEVKQKAQTLRSLPLHVKEGGSGSTETPNVNEWDVQETRYTNSKISLLPESPSCPFLLELFLQGNSNLTVKQKAQELRSLLLHVKEAGLGSTETPNGLLKPLLGNKHESMDLDDWEELHVKVVSTIRLNLAPKVKYQVLIETSPTAL
ncbi:hypothetical protein RJ640_013540 [Escallonia rubra]|uniref:Uncharacterized protein n=1 Tax=Escallonia rubra TaxID=112253 RepID=A0AA88U7C9_9ASTE|nr:hypothetical protein RJ640_013540 [Escallonia rubra]